MPLIISIPEADRIRRLAAALVTSKTSGRVQEADGLDFGHTVRMYFRRIPWSGRRAVTVDLALDMSLVTVGQYFMSLDWEGTSGPVSATTESHSEAELSPALLTVAESLATPIETVSLDGFFSNFFDK